MESKGHAAAFLEIRKGSYLGAAFRGPCAIWLGCKLNPREYFTGSTNAAEFGRPGDSYTGTLIEYEFDQGRV